GGGGHLNLQKFLKVLMAHTFEDVKHPRAGVSKIATAVRSRLNRVDWGRPLREGLGERFGGGAPQAPEAARMPVGAALEGVSESGRASRTVLRLRVLRGLAIQRGFRADDDRTPRNEAYFQPIS
ncbi:MAG: hypothetical protein R3B70_48515, partial [Polyangiaceae bacterium]